MQGKVKQDPPSTQSGPNLSGLVTWPLRQIRYFQHTQATMLLIQKLPFSRVMCEIAQDCKMDLRFTATAVLALHDATEYFLVEVIEKANLAAIHHKRITIAPKDMYLVRTITHMW